MFFHYADMAELADALGSGPSDRKVVEVRVLLSAPKISDWWLVCDSLRFDQFVNEEPAVRFGTVPTSH